MGHGRAMINIDDEKMQINIYEKIISKNLSVRNTEKLIQSLKKEGSLKIQDKIQIPSNSKKNITKATIIREKIENFWVAPLCKRAERKAMLKSSLLTDIFLVKTN